MCLASYYCLGTPPLGACTHPLPVLGHLLWFLLWAWQNIFLIFPAPSMLWCFWGQIILWSWGSRPSHLWGGLHDLILSGRRRTLGLDVRGYWKWGGLEFFILGSRGHWRPQANKIPYCERLVFFFSLFGSIVLRLVRSILLGACWGSCLLKMYTTVKLVVLVVARWCLIYVVNIYE